MIFNAALKYNNDAPWQKQPGKFLTNLEAKASRGRRSI